MQNVESKKLHHFNKYHIIVTFCFFLVVSYVAFFHHNYWTFDIDGYFYLEAGKQILSGDGQNVKIIHAGPGGPVLFAVLDSVLHDGFFAVKLISVLSGTGMVFFSYYIIRNIFDSKTAFLGQLFFTFNPWIFLFAIQAKNEFFSIFLAMVATYLITKKTLRLNNVIIAGCLVGAAFMFRYQPIFILFAFVVFLLIRDKKIRLNSLYAAILVLFFIAAASPMFLYNYYMYGTLIDSNPDFEYVFKSKYQSPELIEEIKQNIANNKPTRIYLVDFDLFLKNYFYNLFYGMPNNLFGFENKVNSSLIPSVLIIGIIPVLVGAISSLKIKLDKTNVIVLIGSAAITAILVITLGNFSDHFFSIVIIPLIIIGILNFKNIEKNFIPLLIIPIFFSFGMSIILLRAPEHFALIWISIAALSAVFFIKVIPKIYRLKNSINKKEDKINYRIKMVLILLVSLILLSNIVYSYVTLRVLSSGDPFISIDDEIRKILENEPLEKTSIEIEEVVKILSNEPEIKESYVGTFYIPYGYYLDSKRVHFFFTEGPENDTIENYITRKNWKGEQIFLSNLNNKPIDRNNLNNPIPDYLIYYKQEGHHDYLTALANPEDPTIPSNFEVLYKSKTGTVLYKIHHDKED